MTPILDSRLTTHDSRLTTHDVTTPDSRLTTHDADATHACFSHTSLSHTCNTHTDRVDRPSRPLAAAGVFGYPHIRPPVDAFARARGVVRGLSTRARSTSSSARRRGRVEGPGRRREGDFPRARGVRGTGLFPVDAHRWTCAGSLPFYGSRATPGRTADACMTWRSGCGIGGRIRTEWRFEWTSEAARKPSWCTSA